MTAALAVVLAAVVALVVGVVVGSAVTAAAFGWLFVWSDDDEWEAIGGFVATATGARREHRAGRGDA